MKPGPDLPKYPLGLTAATPIACVCTCSTSAPRRYESLGIQNTEFNHLWKTDEARGDVGWASNHRAAGTIAAAHDAAKTHGLAGLAIYRWEGDAWKVRQNGAVLDTIAARTRGCPPTPSTRVDTQKTHLPVGLFVPLGYVL